MCNFYIPVLINPIIFYLSGMVLTKIVLRKCIRISPMFLENENCETAPWPNDSNSNGESQTQGQVTIVPCLPWVNEYSKNELFPYLNIFWPKLGYMSRKLLTTDCRLAVTFIITEIFYLRGTPDFFLNVVDSHQTFWHPLWLILVLTPSHWVFSAIVLTNHC